MDCLIWAWRSSRRFHLYLNRGGLKFEEVTATRGIPDLDSPFGVSFIGVDNDRDSDLFITCGGYQSRMPSIPGESPASRTTVTVATEVPDAAGCPSRFNFPLRGAI